jgi:hypothetical protein
MDYLVHHGFSKQFIECFFRPFFAGIFLEKSLDTSSRMFEFVLKMFVQGKAAIPAKGIQEIAIQLKSKLKNTTFLFNSTVSGISGQAINLSDGRLLTSDYIVIATEPMEILPTSHPSYPTKWRRCINLYFELEKPILDNYLLALVANKQCLVNNFHFIKYSDQEKSSCVVSVTILDDFGLGFDQLVLRVTEEVKSFCSTDKLKLIQSFDIDYALPINRTAKYTPGIDDIRLTDRVFLAGDHLANPSLNGAMESGKAAADLLLHSYLAN